MFLYLFLFLCMCVSGCFHSQLIRYKKSIIFISQYTITQKPDQNYCLRKPYNLEQQFHHHHRKKMEEVQNHVFEEAAEGSATEKVYIAVGSDIQEGFKTIDWALKKWHNTPISIVLLHFCNILQDFVYTPCTISSFSIRTSSFSFQSYKPQFTSLSQLGSSQRVL